MDLCPLIALGLGTPAVTPLEGGDCYYLPFKDEERRHQPNESAPGGRDESAPGARDVDLECISQYMGGQS